MASSFGIPEMHSAWIQTRLHSRRLFGEEECFRELFYAQLQRRISRDYSVPT